MSATKYSLYTPTTNHAGETLTRNDTVTVIWNINGSPDWDSCTVAIRSLTDPELIIAVINPHPQCGSGSATFVIPDTPVNDTLKYDGTSQYMVRINTPHGTYADSAPFLIAENKPTIPWSRTDHIALAGAITGGAALLVASVVGVFQIRSERRAARRDREERRQRVLTGAAGQLMQPVVGQQGAVNVQQPITGQPDAAATADRAQGRASSSSTLIQRPSTDNGMPAARPSRKLIASGAL